MDTVFTQEVQDKIMVSRLRGMRGFDEFLAGTKTVDDMALSLSQEFASLPVPYDYETTDKETGTKKMHRAGVSYYDGDGLNSSLTSVEKVKEMLERIKAYVANPAGGSQQTTQRREQDTRVAGGTTSRPTRPLRRPGTAR